MTSEAEMRTKLLRAFRMPSFQTIVSRKSSITNAFVISIVPKVVPTTEEIHEALSILGMQPDDVRCSYCGDVASEWDHLRPLVMQFRPTGFITEIANLVPSCGKCNQSKGNKAWREWMEGTADRSPTGRKIQDVAARIERLTQYETWRRPTRIDFEAIIGREKWEAYWALYEALVAELSRSQDVANAIRQQVDDWRGRP